MCRARGRRESGSKAGYRAVSDDGNILGKSDGALGTLRLNRTLSAGAKPLACADLHEGIAVEVNGRQVYRSGRIVAVEPYAVATDTIFPCMAITDMEAAVGDSGGAVVADGAPPGVTAREFGGRLGFTPLAEGLEDLGLTLCTDPDCGLRRP